MKLSDIKFSHTYSVHSCLECKEYTHTSRGAPMWSRFYLLMAVGLALPWSIYGIFGPLDLPWYNVFGIVAGEMLLFYAVSLASVFLLMLRDIRPSRCPKCRALLSSTGSYYSDGEKPNLDDFVVIVMHLGTNVAFLIFACAVPSFSAVANEHCVASAAELEHKK
jgi:hypothetical protein